MRYFSILIKPASSTCNLKCKYCFYRDISENRVVKSFGRMKDETVAKLIDNVYADLADGDHLAIAFQGGEPTMAGLRFFENFVETINNQKKKINVNYALQTNGTLINEKWCRFLKENNFLVGLSIDGPAKFHDLYRLDSKNQGTFKTLILTKALLEKFQIDFNVLCVLTSQLAKHPYKVFRFILDNHIKYIQFIPCLDEIGVKKRSQYALTPELFASFYREIAHLWFEELRKENYISIKLFDDIVNLMVKHQVTSCGLVGQCSFQFVVEADGSVYPCDFYAIDEYRVGNIRENTLLELIQKAVVEKFLHSRKQLPDLCRQCPFLRMCNGGCKRMKDAMYVDGKKEFCGYQDLLRNFIPQINSILEYVH